MTSGQDEKTVCVQLEFSFGDDVENYDISFVNKGEKSSDLDVISKKLKQKNSDLCEASKLYKFVYKKKSVVNPDSWVVIGEKSPVKNGSHLLCSLKPLRMANVLENLSGARSEASSSVTLNTSLTQPQEVIPVISVAHTGTSSNLILNNALDGVQGVRTGTFSHTMMNHALEGVQGTISLSGERTGTSSHDKMNHALAGVQGAISLSGERTGTLDNVMLNHCEGTTPLSDNIPSPVTGTDSDISSVTTNVDDTGDDEEMPANPKLPKQPRRETSLRSAAQLPTGKIPLTYKVPNNFRQDLQKILDDPEAIILPCETAAVLREVASSIQQFTYEPTSQEYYRIIEQLVDKYPNVSIQPTKDLKMSVLTKKLRKLMSRRRGLVSQAESSVAAPKKKRGRPKKQKQYLGPGNNQEESLVFDQVSYEEHNKKMLDTFQKGPQASDDGVDLLMKFTFPGRRREWGSSNPDSIQHFIDSRCLFLGQITYLLKEMDLIVGEGTCHLFRQQWMDAVPLIIKAAKMRKIKSVASILKPFKNLSTDFDARSRAAMELLPVVLPGKHKGEKARRFFVDSRMESANLGMSIKEIPRSAPFILFHGDAIHLVLESRPFLRFETTTEALLALMAAYYVFTLTYADQVKPTLFFLQSYCMKKPDDDSDSCEPVAVFVKLMQREKQLLAATSSEDETV